MAATLQSSPARQPARRRPSRLARRERNWGLVFLAPWIIGFCLFFAAPMLASLVFSFTNYNLLKPGETSFIGLENWRRMVNDPNVRQSLGVTIRFLLVSVPVAMAVPLGLALLVNSRYLLGKHIFRTLFYMPMMVPIVAGTMIWQGVLNTQSGWLNRILGALGLPGPDWINNPHLVIPTLTLIGIWGIGNTMVIMLAGLQNVPTELYDAALVDGAGPFYRFFKITLPLISPVIFYNLVLAMIGAFQYFLQPFVIWSSTNGAGPNNASLFYMVNLYREGWAYYQMGYASTLAWAMFFVALLVTVALFATAKRWVYYAGEK
ncbi:MAG: ABC transporter [Herpetosiphonaceae bacterium]|nr:MAG: ABC transporter [Herpetosiphonaceae bacterium]